MKTVYMIAAVVILLAITAATSDAQSLVPQAQIGTWTIEAKGAPGLSCSVAGRAGPGHMSLTVAADRPGVVELQLDRAGMKLPDTSQLMVVMTFASFSSFILAGARVAESNAVLVRLDAKTLPQWLQQFTAGQSASFTVQGSGEPPWQFPLQGTASAIDAMQKCIVAENIFGVPLPFKSGAIAPAVAPSRDRCLQFLPAKATIVGKATLGLFPSGHTYAVIIPDRPVCITGGDASRYEDAKELTAIALYFDENAVLPKKWQGKHVKVTGSLKQANPDEVATPNFMAVDSINASP